MSAVRVQLSRKKGWRMPENTVKVDRTSSFGNPFKPIEASNREQTEKAVAYFRRYLEPGEGSFSCGPSEGVSMAFIPPYWHAGAIRDALPKLAGKNLACWCPLGSPCHADVLLELANPLPLNLARVGEEG